MFHLLRGCPSTQYSPVQTKTGIALEKQLVKGETDVIILDPFAALLEQQGKRNVV